MTTLEKLADLLHRDFDIPREALVADATLESLAIDSLRMIEIVFVVEDAFGVDFPDDGPSPQARNAGTLGALAAYIDTLPRKTPA
ncbi:MAG TPA: phosphopantetheine-binding protein [Terriglobales bacterium]|nr:phosphopantetheine-binding protein [Terriglobales bacterium]